MARGFLFKLQPVLDQRERVEEQCMLAVAQLERERIAIEDRLRTLQAQIAGSKQDLRTRLAPDVAASDSATSQGAVSVVDVRLQANASLYLTGQAQRAALELAGAYRRLESARAKLLEAATGRKAVEVLKQRRHTEWKHEQTRREFVQLDEILSNRRGVFGAMNEEMPS